MSHALDLTRPSAHRARFPKLTALVSLARQRRALAKLDSTQLNDIGLSRSDAENEANRPVWDVPAHWQR